MPTKIVVLVLALAGLCAAVPLGSVQPEELTGCFNWPTIDFSRTNHAQVMTAFARGNRYVDLDLWDMAGAVVALSELVGDRPVMVEACSWTCPVAHREISETMRLVDHYPADAIDFVYVYTIEAHPEQYTADLDVGPFHGVPTPREFSDGYRQANSTATRMAYAADWRAKIPQRPNLRVLVDPFSYSLDQVNPFWCTYGTFPNGGILIAPNGTVVEAQDWFHAPSMKQAIDQLLLTLSQ